MMAETPDSKEIIAALRHHKTSHDYLEINPETLWDVYNNNFFGLERKLYTILEKEDK